jgi:sterol desaturase/sphingolipid hydroxylase (fatty acid hydroxylase superfamily)
MDSAFYFYRMENFKRLIWLCGFLFVCGLLVASGSEQLHQLVSAHAEAQVFLVLSLFWAIPASLITLMAAYQIEWLFLGWAGSSLKLLREGRASVKLDALSIAMNFLPHRFLSYVLSLGLLYVIDTRAAQGASISITRYLPSWGMQIAFALLFQSFVSYWLHRLEHSIPALWALHKYHHSADRMSILTSERGTDLIKGVEGTLRFLPYALVADSGILKPAPGHAAYILVIAYFAYRTFLRVNGYLVHSNLTTDYGWVGRWLLVSPRMHRLHHAASAEYHNKNFTFDFVLWDRLFGTYATCEASAAESISLGLNDNPFNGDKTAKAILGNYFLTPYIVFFQALRTGFAAWLPARLSAGRKSVVF